MAQKYTLNNNGNATDKLAGVQAAAIHLSDGTLVTLDYDNAAGGTTKLSLNYSTTHGAVVNIGHPNLSAATEFADVASYALAYSLCRDNLDNLYVVAQSSTGNVWIGCKAYTKGAGLTWTAQTRIQSVAGSGSFEIEGFMATWCNTGGGTASKGHIMVLLGHFNSGASAYRYTYAILDAGAALAGTGTLVTQTAENPTFMGTATEGNTWGQCRMDIANDGFGAVSGLAAGIYSYTFGGAAAITIGRWGVSSTGTLNVNTNITTTLATKAVATAEKLRLLWVSANLWVIVYPSNTTAGRWKAATYSSTALGTAGVESPAVTNWPASSETNSWDAVVVAGKLWVYAWSTANALTMLRLGCAVSAGAITWDVTAPVDDTAVGSGGTNSTTRLVRWPTTNAFIDWQTWNSFGASYALLGDYSVFVPPNPTALTPLNASTVTTDVPTLGMTITAGAANSRGEWQIATDAGFTTNLKTVIEPIGDAIASGVTSEVVPTGSQLFQGVWYLRGRARTIYDDVSGWIGTNSFTVSHPPSTTGLTPTGGVVVAYGAGSIALNWTFSDTSPVDNQTAFQVIVERNSDGLSIVDSTKTASAAGSYAAAIPAIYKGVPLRWKVRVWDSDDVVGSYSSYQVFTTDVASTNAITSPANGGVVTTAVPTVNWTYTPANGRAQATYQVVFRTNLGVLVYDSGVLSGTATTYTAPSAILTNGGSWSVSVTTVDSGGLSYTSTNNFTTAWVAPANVVPTIDTTLYASSGYVTVAWTNSTKDASWLSYKLYRRVTGTTTWILVGTYTNVATNYSYQDWYVPGGGVSYDYAVTQTADRFGDTIEGNPQSVTAGAVNSGYYWWIYEPDTTKSLRMEHTVGDSFKPEYDAGAFPMLGRGRHSERGTRFGYSGTLKGQVRDIDGGKTGHQQRLDLEGSLALTGQWWLRSPFGDLFRVFISDMSFDRTPGVGTRDFADVSIEYQEVAI